MRIAFTFRNLESSEAIKRHATEKLSKLQKYVRAPIEAEVTLSVDRHLHCIDVSMTSRGESYMGREESGDMYASIDSVVDKIKKQLIRHKDVKDTRRRSSGSWQAVSK